MLIKTLYLACTNKCILKQLAAIYFVFLIVCHGNRLCILIEDYSAKEVMNEGVSYFSTHSQVVPACCHSDLKLKIPFGNCMVYPMSVLYFIWVVCKCRISLSKIIYLNHQTITQNHWKLSKILLFKNTQKVMKTTHATISLILISQN